jgi:hypothetical protein
MTCASNIVLPLPSPLTSPISTVDENCFSYVENDKSTTNAIFKLSLSKYDSEHTVGLNVGFDDGSIDAVGVSLGLVDGFDVHASSSISSIVNKSPYVLPNTS